jgi:predicted nuclease of predicted toxin-antitoxin system
VRILVDESVDFPVVEALRTKSFDVKYIAESKAGISDNDVLRHAEEESRILLTADKDFGELVYRMGMIHSGVILYRLNGLDNSQKIQAIISAFNSHSDEFRDRFTVISKTHIRIRKAI